MKFLVVNKKRLGVIVIIIGLMCILFSLENKFDKRLKSTALIQKNIQTLKSYSGLDNKLNYKLPADWSTKEQKFSGGEIIYHNDFQSNDLKVYGFVQVWNLNQDLKAFLDNSKEISEKGTNLKEYKITPINIDNNQGYLVSYTISNSKGLSYKAYEYYIKEGNNKFVRFSFFTSVENMKENMPTIFETIVKTMSYKN